MNKQELEVFHKRLSKAAAKLGAKGTYDSDKPNFRKIRNKDAFHIYFRTAKSSKVFEKMRLTQNASEFKTVLEKEGLRVLNIYGGCGNCSLSTAVGLDYSKKIN